MDKKVIAAILIGIVAVFGLVNIVASSGDNNKPVAVKTDPRVGCATGDEKLRSQWNDFAALLDEAMKKYVDSDLLTKRVVDEITQGINTTRDWIASCGKYMPEAAQQYERFIRDVSIDLDRIDGD